MIGAQPMLTYTVSYTYVIFVMLSRCFKGLRGIMIWTLACRFNSHGFKSQKNFASIMN